MNYKTKEILKKVGIFLLISVAIAAAIFAFVPSAKAWFLDKWESCKGMFSKKK